MVVGSSFAGLTAALEVKRRMKERAEVTVLDRRDHFTFIPSLVWLPFGKRSAEDVTFKLGPVYERKGIRFVHAAAEGFSSHPSRSSATSASAASGTPRSG